MGVSTLNTFVRFNLEALIDQGDPVTCLQEAFAQAGSPNSLFPVYLDAAQVFWALHHHAARSSFKSTLVGSLTEHLAHTRPCNADTPVQFILGAVQDTQYRTSAIISGFLRSLHCSLSPPLQRAIRFIIIVDNPDMVTRMKIEQWKSRHGVSASLRKRLIGMLENRDLTAVQHLSVTALAKLVPFPSARTLASHFQCVAAEEVSAFFPSSFLPLFQQYTFTIIGSITEADATFERLAHNLQMRGAIWSSDSDWYLGSQAACLPTALRCVPSHWDTPFSANAVLWDLAALEQKLQINSLDDKQLLRVLSGDDYGPGLPKLGVAKAVKYDLHTRGFDGIRTAIQNSTATAQLKQTWSEAFTDHQQELHRHLVFLKTRQAPHIAVSSLLDAAESYYDSSDGILLPFDLLNHPDLPDEVQRRYKMRDNLRDAGATADVLPKLQQQIISSRPGRQHPKTKHLLFESKAILRDYVLPATETIFTAKDPEEPFCLDDSTKRGKKGRSRGLKQSVRPTQPSNKARPATASSRRQQDQDTAQQDEDARVQGLSAEKKTLYEDLRRQIAEAPGQEFVTSIKHRYPRALYPAPSLNIFRHLDFESAQTRDNSMSKVVQLVGFTLAAVKPGIAFAISRFITHVVSSDNVNSWQALKKANSKSLVRVLASALTMSRSVYEEVINLPKQSAKFATNYDRLLEYCVSHELTISDAQHNRAQLKQRLNTKMQQVGPLTVFACCPSSLTTLKTPSKHLSIDIVLAVDDYIQQGFTLLTPQHLGVEDEAISLMTNFQSTLASQVLECVNNLLLGKAKTALTDSQGCRLSQRQSGIVINLVRSALLATKPTPHHAKDAALRLRRDLRERLRTFTSLGATRMRNAEDESIALFHRLFALLLELIPPRFPNHPSLASLLDPSSKIDPARLACLVVRCLGEEGKDFELTCSPGSAVRLPSDAMLILLLSPITHAEALAHWLSHRFASRRSILQSAFPSRHASEQHSIWLFDCLLDDAGALTNRARTRLGAFAAAVRGSVDDPDQTKGVFNLLSTTGTSFLAAICFRLDKMPGHCIPTLDVVIGPGSIALVTLDIREPKFQHNNPGDEVVQLFTTFLQQASLLGNGDGCALVRPGDFSRLNSFSNNFQHYVSPTDILHPHNPFPSEALNLPSRQLKETLQGLHGAQRQPLPALPQASVQPPPAQQHPLILSIDVSFQLPYIALASLRRNSSRIFSRAQFKALATAPESAMGHLIANDQIGFRPWSKPNKEEKKGLPKLYRAASPAWTVQHLKSAFYDSLTDDDSEELREELSTLTEKSTPSDQLVQAVGAWLQPCVFIGVDKGEAAELAVSVRAFDDTDKPFADSIIFTNKTLRHILKTAQRRSHRADRTLPFDLWCIRQSTPTTPVSSTRLSASIYAAWTQERGRIASARRRQQASHIDLRVNQILASVGRHSSLAYLNVQLAAPSGQRSLYLVVGDDFDSSGRGPSWANPTLSALAKRLAGEKDDFHALLISEFCSSQRCLNPECHRPRDSSDESSALIRSLSFNGTFMKSGNTAYRVLMCEECRLVCHRDAQAGVLMWQALVHQLKFLRHPFEPAAASEDEWSESGSSNGSD